MIDTTKSDNADYGRFLSMDCSPSSIYLQWHGDAEPSEFCDGPEPSDVTWAKEKIWDHDLKYIRADLVEKLMESVAARIAADQAAVPYTEKVLKCWNAVREILLENETSAGTASK